MTPITTPLATARCPLQRLSLRCSQISRRVSTILGLIMVLGVASVQAATVCPFFQSAFEPNSQKTGPGTSYSTDIVGKDTSVANGDWVADLEGPSDITQFLIEYYGGDLTMRHTRIVADPTNPANRVLHYWINKPNNIYTGQSTYQSGRIQATLKGDGPGGGLKELYYSVRVLLPHNMGALRAYPQAINWFTLAEFWSEGGFSRYGDRTTFGIGKRSSATGDLHFHVYNKLQQPDSIPWGFYWSQVPVPIGKWFTLEIYVKEGKTDGRFYAAFTPTGGARTVLFDVKKPTMAPNDPNLNGFKDASIMKLYTSTAIVNYMRSRGSLNLYWDDLKIWKNRTPESFTFCRTARG